MENSKPESQNPNSKSARTRQMRALLVGGLLPVIAFTVIEEYYGVLWGLVAGMVFGVGEILWEWFTVRKVDPLTWGGNGILLLLGGISLFTQEGIWFKLQPALMEMAFTLLLWGSLIWGKPLLLVLAQKQGGLPKDLEGMHPRLAEAIQKSLKGMTFRLGVFMAIQSGIAVWAALYWSTAAWAALKGVGLTVSMVAYLVVESLVLRYRVGTSR
jgi:intracellular septation protein